MTGKTNTSVSFDTNSLALTNTSFKADVKAMMRKLQSRCHWGKIHTWSPFPNDWHELGGVQ